MGSAGCHCALVIALLSFLVHHVPTVHCQRPNPEQMAGRRLDVYIAGFFPFGPGVEHSATGRGVMPSVRLAIDHVNEHNEVLRNYRLHMWWNDTKCNAAVGVKAFFDMMHSGPHKLMLFGAACTHVTDPIAKASKHWQLTQLSYADTHPMFTSEAFPNFFRIVPSENAFNAPRLALLRQFNWTRVGTIYQNEPRYSLAHNRLVADLDMLGLEVVETQSFTTDVTDALWKLRNKDVRVILGNFNESWARRVFCEAFRFEMFGRAYQWLIMGNYNSEWWTKPADINCTVEELAIALESTILTDLLPLSTSGHITISGITADEYRAEYDSRRGNEYSRFHGYTYDGIWAVAIAIQHVAQRVKALKREQSVADFKYRDPMWGALFLEALKNTSFEGVTGPVRFYDNERRASILLKQFQNGAEVKVGEYVPNTTDQHERLDLELGEPLRWIGRAPPKDRTLHLVEHSQVNITIYAVLASCAALGIVMASVFLAINIKYRNQRYIKMSSPHLNNLIIVGCMLTYLSVIFLGLDSGLSSVRAFPYICTARAWLLMAGFSLAFGAMFSKTWRVHSIFTDVKLNKKVIKDYQLFMVVGVLLAVDLAIMTTWQVADPFYRATKQMEPYPHPTSEDVLVVRENEYCQSERMTIFVGVIYAYKGLLMIFGAFLAWETRHVSIPALNDSKHVGLSVYNVVLMCIMGAAIALVLSDRKDAMFVIISLFIIFCTTATLCLVFVPKLVELRRNPGGSIDKRIRATLRPMSKTRRDSSACELEQRLREVKNTNCRFRKALLEREAELQVLMRRLGPEARGLLEAKRPGGDIPPTTAANNNSNRLAVPLLRCPSTTETTAPASATETSDMTSMISLTSSQDLVAPAQVTPEQKKPKTEDTPPPEQADLSVTEEVHPAAKQEPQQIQQPPPEMQQLPQTQPPVSQPVAPIPVVEQTIQVQPVEPAQEKIRSVSFGQHDARQLNGSATRHDSGNESERRSRTPQQSFVVSQSDLWDTAALAHNKICNRPARTCPMAADSSPGNRRHCPASESAQSPAQSPMHRSVSEKNRHRGHRHKTKQQPNQQQQIVQIQSIEMEANRCGVLSRNARTHHRSTPDVARIAPSLSGSTTAMQSTQIQGTSVHAASSESELLDGAILPIFRKLLTEREPRRGAPGAAVGASCPNISIKCDIVEYL